MRKVNQSNECRQALQGNKINMLTRKAKQSNAPVRKST